MVGSAKDIRISPIKSKDARRIIRNLHYSGKVVNNSQLHFGVFLGDKCEGVLQFGPSLDKTVTINTVSGTGWNEFIELNRMAFSEKLPRNSESRALGYCMRLLKKKCPHIKWVISFSDATMCGDGTIYRASGFKLIGIKENTEIRRDPETGELVHAITAHKGGYRARWNQWEPIKGFQMKYIYFLDSSAEKDLSMPILPFSAIADAGAGMYKGEKRVK